jgi:hypothetical protein
MLVAPARGPRRLALVAAAAASCLALAAPVPRAAASAPAFVEVPQFGSDGPTIAVAWGDAERDGDMDLAVANTNGQQNALYRNDGGGTYAELPRFGLGSTFALVWGDVDNDGDLDVAVGNREGFASQNRLVVNNGDGTFSGQNQFGSHQTIAMAWADFDLDGDLDLAVGNGILGTAEQNFLYRNDGGTFTEIPAFGVGQTGSVVWGDFDGDGDPDLAVGNGGFGFVEQNFLYRNDGNETFTELPEFGTGDTACLVAGDYDNDGDLDVAVGNWDATQCRLYENQGDGAFVGRDEFGARDTNTCTWGDFDNDGDLDLAVGNGDFGSADQNYIYDNLGDGTFAEVARLGLGSTDGLAWADADGDGDIDVAAGNEHSPAQNYLYVNQENDADALFLRLVGHRHDLGAGYSNRDGIGAKVRVYAAGHAGDPAFLLGFREIEAHGGFASQNSMEAHFGLPGRATVDVRIEWPGSSGTAIVQTVSGLSVPGMHVVDEAITSTGAPAVSGAFAWGVSPNPAHSRARIELATGPSLAPRAFEILDAAGRRVRRVHAEPAEGERASAEWDLRDDSGRRVAAGMYFVRLADGTGPRARVVVLR